MKTTQGRRGELVFTLEVISNTMADLVLARTDGTLVERRQFVGARAPVLALWAWAKATKLVGGQAA